MRASSGGEERSSCVPVAEAEPFFITTSTPSPLLSRFEATPESRPLCQKPPSPITATARFDDIGLTPAAAARLMPYPSSVLPCENGSNDPQARAPQPTGSG